MHRIQVPRECFWIEMKLQQCIKKIPFPLHVSSFAENPLSGASWKLRTDKGESSRPGFILQQCILLAVACTQTILSEKQTHVARWIARRIWVLQTLPHLLPFISAHALIQKWQHVCRIPPWNDIFTKTKPIRASSEKKVTSVIKMNCSHLQTLTENCKILNHFS